MHCDRRHVVWFSLGLVLLIGCGDDKGTRPANAPPVIRITAGAADSASASYRVTFAWHATDDDGVIDRYQFAVDAPHGAWRDTLATEVTLPFTADEPDPGDPTQFHRWHLFSVRALDNEGGLSNEESRYFDARNVAPRTTIVRPPVREGARLLRSGDRVIWMGEDLDASSGFGLPEAYDCKLIHLAELSQWREPGVLDSITLLPNLLQTEGGDLGTGWLRLPGDRHVLALPELTYASGYLFAIRAIDEARATEPNLEADRNYFGFQCVLGPCNDSLVVSMPGLSPHSFPSSPWDVDVPAFGEIRVSWNEPCDEVEWRSWVSYAYDIASPGDETPKDACGRNGWSPWLPSAGSTCALLLGSDGEATHTLHIRMRPDSARALEEQRHLIRFHPIQESFTRFALLVDDAVLPAIAGDADHDAFLRTEFLPRLPELGEVDDWAAWGDGDAAGDPSYLDLATLFRYQQVVWSTEAADRQTLWTTERERGLLTRYVAMGGRLLLLGGRPSAILTGDAGARDFEYPKDPARDTFLWRYLRARTPIVGLSAGGDDRLRRLSGAVAARPLDGDFPPLEIDREKWAPDRLEGCGGDSTRCVYAGGFEAWEGSLERAGSVVTQAGLDSVYAVRTWNRYWDGDAGGPVEEVSALDGAIIVHRYASTQADTLANEQQGRVVVFGAQPWYFASPGITGAGRALVDWLATGRDP